MGLNANRLRACFEAEWSQLALQITASPVLVGERIVCLN